MIIKWFKALTGKYVEVSEDNRLPVEASTNGAPLDVEVQNFPETQPVSGEVTIGNWPTSQDVTMASRAGMVVQTHNAVVIPASEWSEQTDWMDCAGYDTLNVTLLNDAAVASAANVIWSHDGTTKQGEDSGVIPSGSTTRKAGRVTVKARYAKVTVNNPDTATHTVSAWAYMIT